MKHIFSSTLIISFLSSCYHSDAHYNRKNEITMFEIATGGCFGPCQSTVTSIDSSLVYKYYGGDIYVPLPEKADKNGKLKGYYLSRVSQGFWDTLNIKLENINYKQLDTSYQHSVDDQSLEVFIHYGNKIKHINAQSASLPDTVAKVFYSIINSYKVVKPKAVKDTFEFESNARKPVSLPDVSKVKFLTPDINE